MGSATKILAKDEQRTLPFVHSSVVRLAPPADFEGEIRGTFYSSSSRGLIGMETFVTLDTYS